MVGISLDTKELQKARPISPLTRKHPEALAVHNLEQNKAANKLKALIQRATGSGKTFTAFSFICSLIKFGGARRVLQSLDF